MFERIKVPERIQLILFPSSIKHNQFFGRLHIFLIFVNAVHFLLVAFFLPGMPNILILHSNIYFGIDLIGSWYYIMAPPLLGLLISLVHYILGIVIYPFNKILAFFLLLGAIFIQIFLIIGSWFIIHINI